MESRTDVDAAPVHAVVSATDDKRCVYRPERGVLMLPNRIAIDFGSGITRLSPEAVQIVNNAAQMLSLLDRTSI